MSVRDSQRLEDNVFLALVAVATIAFAVIALPFSGAILWAVVAAILFAPMHRRLRARMPQRENSAALLTLLTIMAVAVVPAIVLGALLLREGSVIYAKVQAGQIDFTRYFEQVQAAMPRWVTIQLDRLGLSDLESVRMKVAGGIGDSFQSLAGQVLNIGQSAFGFLIALGIMLYMTFFLLRDGHRIVATVERAVPLRHDHKHALLAKFIAVVRATIKGSLVVAVVQGMIGGVAFWALGIEGALIWGVAMGFLSLLPAIGTGLVWVPVAIYLLATGSVWQGVTLALVGSLVIGSVDNVLRPILVGRDIKLPDWIVLISTLGGLEAFGFNGFVIGPVIAALFMAVWEIFAASRTGDKAVLDDPAAVSVTDAATR